MSKQPMPGPGRIDMPVRTLTAFTDTLVRQDVKGRATYGTPLRAFNGRDAGRDAFEELVDCAQYLTQLRIEHAECLSLLRDIRARLVNGDLGDGFTLVEAIDAVLGGGAP